MKWWLVLFVGALASVLAIMAGTGRNAPAPAVERPVLGEPPGSLPRPPQASRGEEPPAKPELEKLFEMREREAVAILERQDLSDAEKFQWAWVKYVAHRHEPFWSRFYADVLNALTHGRDSGPFARRIAAEIRSRDVQAEARASLVRALSDTYVQPGDPLRPFPTDQNDFVLAELRDIMDSGYREAALAAVLQYVRLGYFDDVPDRLERAWRQGIIDSETYVKELLLQMPSVTPARQESMLSKLQASGMPMQELAALLPGMAAIRPGLFEPLSPPVRTALARVLAEHEPKFTPGHAYGATEGVDYVDWLVARFEAERPVIAVSNAAAQTRMLAEAAARADDPRKVLAIALSDHGAAVIDELVRTGKADAVIRRLAADASQLPQDAPVLKPLLAVKAAIEQRRR